MHAAIAVCVAIATSCWRKFLEMSICIRILYWAVREILNLSPLLVLINISHSAVGSHALTDLQRENFHGTMHDFHGYREIAWGCLF